MNRRILILLFLLLSALFLLLSAVPSWSATVTNPGGAGGPSTDDLQDVCARGCAFTDADDTTPLSVGDGTTQIEIGVDAGGVGHFIRTNPATDVRQQIPTDKTGGVYSQEGDCDVEGIDPDAATPQAGWTYECTTIRPLGSVWIPAGAMSTDGTQCAAPAEVTINSGAKRYTIICADNDGSTAYAEVAGLDDWDGGTITIRGYFIQTAADTSNLNSDIAAACRPDSEIINNTWGTEVALDGAMEGSSNLDTFLTGAITPNGTCTGKGTLLQLRWQLDATGTTTAVATLHLVGLQVSYTKKSRSH